MEYEWAIALSREDDDVYRAIRKHVADMRRRDRA